MFNAIIIDDESSARNALKNLLFAHCSAIQVLGEASNVREGIAAIKEHNPDLVFLDVQMPDGTGFDLLKQLPKVTFKVIFASAYDKFAIQAFRFSALDYLQKPIEAESLIEACAKLQSEDPISELRQKLDVLLTNQNNFEKIALPTLDGIIFVKIKQICWCESDNNYTNFYLNDGKKIVVSKTLKEYDEMLTPFRFFRIHKSHLINLAYLARYRKGEGGSVVMEDGTELEVSRRRKEDFMQALQRG
ncbi:MAG: response regulator transcription factor [Bacteroidales bacterium]|nr:response regulator transcription factor [Bacteroidales bacterium]